jgi:prepilin-type N-terminal cleavage/methylation domain-containing protein
MTRTKRETYKGSAGFTLIEMMLSVAVITIIAGISAPVYQSFQVRNNLDIATVSIAQSLRRAQVLAQAVDGDRTWGVKVQSGNITVFKGTSYTARDTAFDELFDMPTSTTPSGVSEIVFDKFTGLPQTTGAITLTSSANETKTITINSKGMVAY